MASVWIKTRVTRSGPRFHVGYRLGGRRTREYHAGTFTTRGDAERLHDSIRLQIAAGRFARGDLASPNAAELVYFARLGDLIKIGVSIAPKRRVRALNAELLHVEDGGRHRERELHEAFAHLRVRGEWFQMDERIARYLDRQEAA